MKQATLHAFRQGEDAVIGTFLLSRGEVLCQPPGDEMMEEIRDTVLLDPATGEGVDAEDDPERWLELLPLTYRSAYLRAEFSDDGRPEQEETPAPAPEPVATHGEPDEPVRHSEQAPANASQVIYDAMSAELERILGGQP